MSVKWICDACKEESEEPMPTFTIHVLDVEIQADLCLFHSQVFKQNADWMLEDILSKIKAEGKAIQEEP